MSTTKQYINGPVGTIRYSGKCTHELNRISGEGKVVFDSPDHAAAWMQEQEHLRPQDFQPMNIYRCPYFTHYHLTSRPVKMVDGFPVEENGGNGNGAKPPAAPVKEYRWKQPNGTRNEEAIISAFRNGMKRQEIADKSGINYTTVSIILRKHGLGCSVRPRAKKDDPPVRKVATCLQELDAQQAALEAAMAKLAADRQRLIEMNRVKVEWAVEGASVRVGKHNESLVLTVADWDAAVDALMTLVPRLDSDVQKGDHR